MPAQVYGPAELQQGVPEPLEFFRAHAAHHVDREEGGNLAGILVAAGDFHHGLPGFLPAEQLVFDKFVQGFFHGSSFNQLESIALPWGVSTDSGWNCTARTSYSRCLRAITSPWSSRAVASRQSGSCGSTTHEW